LSKNSEKLLALAREEFGELTEAEVKFFTAVADGKQADFNENGKDERDPANDPANSDQWGEDRQLKADRIAWVFLDREAVQFVTHKGVELKGGRVSGIIGLDGCRRQFPIHFCHCKIDDGLEIRGASLGHLDLSGSHIGGLWGENVEIKGPVHLREGFVASSIVTFSRAVIEGDFDCTDGVFLCRDQEALDLDGTTIGGYVFLRGKFKAKSLVYLLGTRIRGSLECQGASFGSSKGLVLLCDRMEVGGSVFFGDGFQCFGELSMAGSEIKGNLSLDRGSFSNMSGNAITADGMSVHGSLYFRQSKQVNGVVSFAVVRINGTFQYLNVQMKEAYCLDLRGARVGRLWDDLTSWPATQGALRLDGFTFDSLDSNAPHQASSRIKWISLQSQDQFCPQPYEQLASVLEKQGYDKDAREIRIQKRIVAGKFHDSSWLQRRKTDFLRYTTAFGYKPWRLRWWALGVVVTGFLVFGWADSHGMIVNSLSANRHFNPLGYSLDQFLPIVSLGESEGWAIDASTTKGLVVRSYLWFHIGFGWVLASLLAAALTGIVRKQQG
jgi:hypothetical protein